MDRFAFMPGDDVAPKPNPARGAALRDGGKGRWFRGGRLRLVLGMFLCVFWLGQFRAGAGGYLIDAWDTEKGLPDNFVTSLVQTPDGYLWIGTYNGLVRFDGSRFVVFKPANTPQLGHERIIKLFLDAQGALWINTYDGSLTSFYHGAFTLEWNGKKQGVSDAWLVASSPQEVIFAFRQGLLLRRPRWGNAQDWRALNPPGNPPGAYYCQDGGGMVWCSTLNGQLWQLRDGAYQLAPTAGLPGREIHWLGTDLAGQLWVATEKGIAVWTGGQFENRTPAEDADLNVAFFSFTPDGGMLVAGNGRLRKLWGGKWTREFDAWPDLMQEQQLQPTVYPDHDGGVWRVSRGLGVFHITPGGVTQQITVADGLPGDHTTCGLEDREGDFWVGLGNGGIARFRKKYFDTVAPPGPPARPVMSVCEDAAGALWLGAYGGGLNRWEEGCLTNFPMLTPTPGSFVFSVCPEPSGRLWVSAGKEDWFAFEGGQMRPPPVAVHGVKSIFVDREQRVWLGRKDGVACWAEGRLREWNSHNGSIAQPVRALAEDPRGELWMGCDDGNVYRFNGSAPQAVRLPEFAGQQAVWALLADTDGSLWIGTSDAGLLHYADGQFTRFLARDGLPDDLICQILDDGLGNLWLGTHHGIGRVGKAALRAFAAGQAATIAGTVYDRADGLPTLQCSAMYQPAAWRGHDGRLWFATTKGLVTVQPRDIVLNSRPPPVVVEEFLADGKLLRPAAGGGGPDLAGPVVISPGKQNFEFHYTALSLVAAEKINFRYQLEGFDAGWVNAGNRRWVQYSYLKPGNYRFRVRAGNNDGVWNDAGAALDLRVLPFYWETGWFKLSVLLVLIGLIAAFVRHHGRQAFRREVERLEHQRDLEQDRARIARDIHDHIGSGLTRISLLNELLLGEPPGQLAYRVGQITGVTCELMRAMDEIVWAVNPKNDTLESLMNYVCDYAGEFLRPAGISLRLRVPARLPAWSLTSEVRHNLFLAVKEILNNIVKHAGASEVLLELKLNDATATLEIQDNGRGLSRETAGAAPAGGRSLAGGNGLDNLRKRAAAIGGQCRIHSERGGGTRIGLVLPAPRLNGQH